MRVAADGFFADGSVSDRSPTKEAAAGGACVAASAQKRAYGRFLGQRAPSAGLVKARTMLLSKVQPVDQRMRLGMRCRLSPTADVPSHTSGAAMCHVWTAPSWQELSSRKQHWSVQPCVRPLDAVHMTAGHVWTAPSWQELSSRFAALVGAAMCSAFRCGSHDRWP